MIKHLVISGGGPTGLISFGALKTLSQNNVWKLDNIETVWASSIGGFIAICVTLGYEWIVLDDYLLKRPWEKAFGNIKTDLMEVLNNKGIDGEGIFHACMLPLLKGKDLDEDITLKQYYEFNNIDLYLTTCELKKSKPFKMEILSHKTHPDMTLIKALACTTAFPFMFRPMCIDEKAYLDGGILCNFPLSPCLEQENIDINEVLGLRNVYETLEYTPITKNIGFLEFARTLMRKTHKSLDASSTEDYEGPYIIPFECSDCSDYSLWFQCIGDKELRESLVARGESVTKQWMNDNNILIIENKDNEDNVDISSVSA